LRRTRECNVAAGAVVEHCAAGACGTYKGKPAHLGSQLLQVHT
jgi:hypothetical protein